MRQLACAAAAAGDSARVRMAEDGPPTKKARLACKVGDEMPPVSVDFGFGDDQIQINMAERCKGKKVLLLGLPGAFTPC